MMFFVRPWLITPMKTDSTGCINHTEGKGKRSFRLWRHMCSEGKVKSLTGCLSNLHTTWPQCDLDLVRYSFLLTLTLAGCTLNSDIPLSLNRAEVNSCAGAFYLYWKLRGDNIVLSLNRTQVELCADSLGVIYVDLYSISSCCYNSVFLLCGETIIVKMDIRVKQRVRIDFCVYVGKNPQKLIGKEDCFTKGII